jgi:hypothetical protein
MQGRELIIMAKTELYCVSFLRLPDGSRIALDDMTPEQLQEFRAKVVENIERTLTRRFTEHPEELAQLAASGSVELIPEGTEEKEESA